MDPNDDEAPKDPGSLRQYTEKDFEGNNDHRSLREINLIFPELTVCLGHRAHTVFVGLHVPGGGVGKRHHRRHRHHHKGDGNASSSFDKNDFNLRPSKWSCTSCTLAFMSSSSIRTASRVIHN